MNSPTQQTRRGSVLVLVVALLAILFVAGVAFLAVVTAENKQVAVERDDRIAKAVADAVSNAVLQQLVYDVQGGDGYAFNADDAVAETPDWPVARYGQQLGHQAMIASAEPFPEVNGTTVRYTYFTGSNVTKSALHWPMQYDANGLPGDSLAVYTDTMPALDGYNSPRDADGDGVADTFPWPLPASLLPLGLRDQAAARFNDPKIDFSKPGAGDPNELRLALRVVPHGSMIDINNAHPEMIQYAFQFGYSPFVPDPAMLGGPFNPASVEPTLRYRNILTRPQDAVSSIAPALRNLFTPDPLASTATLSAPLNRWWQIAPLDANGNPNVGLTTSPIELGLFDRWMEPTPPAAGTTDLFDRRHITTTISHDSLLLRGGVSLNAAGQPQDWIAAIRSNEPPPGPSYAPGNFEIDAYPLADPTQPVTAGSDMDHLLGRPLVSLPWIENVLLSGGGVNSILSDPMDPASHPNAQRAIRLIQDAFMLMLRNVTGDFNGDGMLNATDNLAKAERAAMLTANLIDFADIDEKPTLVQVRNIYTGLPVMPPRAAAGVERQPYISEIFAISGTMPAEYVYAVELQDPYGGASLATGPYFLDVIDVGGAPTLPAPLPLINIPGPPPAEHVVYLGGNPGTVTIDPAPASLTENLSHLEFKTGDRIRLIRRVSYGPSIGDVDIVIDEMTVPANPTYPPSAGTGKWSGNQRSAPLATTTVGGTTVPDPNNWLVTVPLMDRRLGGAAMQIHTLGSASGTVTLMDPNESNSATAQIKGTRPVQAEFDNSGSLTTAFPTTGSLALLLGYGQLRSAAPAAAPTDRAFTSFLATDHPRTDRLARDRKIDNGRMPIFDQSRMAQLPTIVAKVGDPPHTTANNLNPSGGDDVQVHPAGNMTPQWATIVRDGGNGVLETAPTGNDIYAKDDRLDVPWGQLVFDYFTALPLNYARPNPYDRLDLTPNVEGDGLRVNGRINLNTAPWWVISGVPVLLQSDVDPVAGRPKLPRPLNQANIGHLDLAFTYNPAMTPPDQPVDFLDLNMDGMADDLPTIGEQLAKAIVCYRERRNMIGTDTTNVGIEEIHTSLSGELGYDVDRWDAVLSLDTDIDVLNDGTCSNTAPDVDLNDNGVCDFARGRTGAGLVTVGELANLCSDQRRPPLNSPPDPAGRAYKINSAQYDDMNVLMPAGDNYLHAVARLVAITDWVTTRSDVFTVYGVIRGQGDRAAVDARAVRFQETVDRSPALIGGKPRLIGEQIVEPYLTTAP